MSDFERIDREIAALEAPAQGITGMDVEPLDAEAAQSMRLLLESVDGLISQIRDCHDDHKVCYKLTTLADVVEKNLEAHCQENENG